MLSLFQSSVVPPSFSSRECGTTLSASHRLAMGPLCLAARFRPPTGLDECFFFNSLVVGLPYSSIFCQFWLFFVFKFVILLLVVGGGTVCLPTPPSWPDVPTNLLRLDFDVNLLDCLPFILVMVNFMCYLDWPSGCPDIRSNILDTSVWY